MDLENAQILVSTKVDDLIDVCPHCGARAHIARLWDGYHELQNGSIEFYVIFRCKPCEKLILKTLFFKQNPYSQMQELESKGWQEKFPMSLDNQLSKNESEYIPEQVLLDYEEALKCKSIKANRASCSMFRRALQSSIVVLGGDKKKNLIQQINSLDSLPNDIKDWAHQIRIFGNWGAHPDEDNLKVVDSDDVAEVHDFISKFFIFMFIMPEKVKISRANRDKKLKKKKEEISDE